MSKTRLAVFFGGTDMTWEDTAVFLQLGAKNRHNFHDKTAKHLYYMFDGPAHAVSNQHKPVENLQFDKNQADDFMRSAPRQVTNAIGYRYRWAKGKGTNHIADAAYELIRDTIIERGIREIDLSGFSRGGNIALIVGSLLSKFEIDLAGKLTSEEIKSIRVNINTIDPVAGKSRNKSAHEYGPLSKFVKTCIVGLATNESVPGFHPRDSLSTEIRYQIQYGPETQFIVLPFPDDHAMCVQWMREIVQRQIPKDSELSAPCAEQRLIRRRLGLAEVKWIDRIDETRAYRVIHYVHNKPKYFRTILATSKQGTEEFFKYLGSQQSNLNIGHSSLQNDADTEQKNRVFEGKKIGGLHLKTKSTQQSFAKRNFKKRFRIFTIQDRDCKIHSARYKNNFFVNLLHEAQFAKSYPHCHQFLLRWDAKYLDRAITEFDAIAEEQFFFTKTYIGGALKSYQKYVEQMLHANQAHLRGELKEYNSFVTKALEIKTSLQLMPLEHFKSTNAKNYTEILNLTATPIASSTPALECKDAPKPVEKKAAAHPAKEVEHKPCRTQLLQFAFFKSESGLLPTLANIEKIALAAKR